MTVPPVGKPRVLWSYHSDRGDGLHGIHFVGVHGLCDQSGTTPGVQTLEWQTQGTMVPAVAEEPRKLLLVEDCFPQALVQTRLV